MKTQCFFEVRGTKKGSGELFRTERKPGCHRVKIW